jgi:hypothetical protein
MAFLVGPWAFAPSVMPPDSRLTARLNPATASIIQALVDSLTRARLPGFVVANRALEVNARGGSDAAIVDGARRFAGQLAAARSALGDRSSAGEVRWGAVALESGLPAADLKGLRAAAPRRQLSTALVVTCDMLTARVPLSTVSGLVSGMLDAGVSDAVLLQLLQEVRLDIALGASPSAAATARSRGAIARRTPLAPAIQAPAQDR